VDKAHPSCFTKGSGDPVFAKFKIPDGIRQQNHRLPGRIDIRTAKGIESGEQQSAFFAPFLLLKTNIRPV
jgi:hypothetical protein